MLNTTFPFIEYERMSRFSKSIFPNCGSSCLALFGLISVISMTAPSAFSKSMLEGRVGSSISVPTTSSSGAISNLSSFFDIKYNNTPNQATKTNTNFKSNHKSQGKIQFGRTINQCTLILQSNKFLYLLHRCMPSSKSKRALEKQSSSRCQPPPEKRLTKIKFNISVDSLRPFVEGEDSNRTTRRRPAFSEFSPNTNTKNAKEEPTHTTLRQAKSPDLAREVSNEILQKIEARGIGCAWEEGQQGRVQCQEEEWDRRVWLPSGQDKHSSLASTSDLSLYLSYYDYCQRLRQLDPLYFQIDASRISSDARTTLMIKNIPNKYTIQLLAQEIDKDHANSYDFLYLPCDIKNNCNVGYGFVNFLDLKGLQSFYASFQAKRWGKFKSEKICTLTYARLQGLQNLIEHFQNSKVLNHKDKKYQPIIREFASINHLLQKQRGNAPDA